MKITFINFFIQIKNIFVPLKPNKFTIYFTMIMVIAFRIFGCEAGIPNFDYTLEDAVKEKYLVGYHVINRTSKMLSKGIDYNNLTKDEKAQLDEYLEEDPPTPDFNIPGNELFKYLFNKDTCRRVLEELMQWGYRVDSGETLGKTIIFAYNHKHA